MGVLMLPAPLPSALTLPQIAAGGPVALTGPLGTTVVLGLATDANSGGAVALTIISWTQYTTHTQLQVSVPLDVTGAALTVQAQKNDGGSAYAALAAAVTVVSTTPTLSVLDIAFAAADVAAAGSYLLYVHIAYGTGDVYNTAPVLLDIATLGAV